MYDRLDHVGIFLLIAGSYTPIAWNLLRARWRFGVLASAWGVAAAGSGLILGLGVLPPLINTAIYLGMGWGAIFCYIEIASRPVAPVASSRSCWAGRSTASAP